MEEFVSRGEYEERLKRVDDENNRQNKRLESLEKIMETIHELTASVRELAVQMEAMQKELAAQGKRLEAIEKEPADNWRSAVKTVLTILLTAAVTYLLSHGGI